MSAPREIVELVEGFGRRINEYRSSQYNETDLRDEFVNPFFAALGWDVHNRQGLSSDSKEVKLEEFIRMEESIKNPDYSFRLGKSRKFFVETKKPSINIEGGVYPAFQLRRYAWSASLAISILTDFEEFAVYDCRAEPSKTDKSGKGRLLYLQYDQYVERWDEIAAIFSKEAVLGGSLERFIESIPEKRGIKRVDAALLEEISLWRESLARSIALGNPALSQRDLNFSVQRTIDRLLFLRICEDRAIEEYGRLKALLKEEGVYARLLKLFAEADERYNSGIFHFQETRERKESPDSLTTALAIDDSTLKGIIQDLYFPDSPYVFSEIPAEILGQVYEQFLGKVIRLEEGRKAIVEDKPEVRKAGGVYYTPPYIVEYIVKNTVGKLLQDNTPAKAAKLRILDPACGSGSFLIGAYQFLLDWHIDWYRANLAPLLEKNQSSALSEVLRLLPAAPEQRSDRRARKIHARAAQASVPIFKANGNEWRLTTTERKRILQSNIYGVDIDPQAVEVTKLSLLLKVLEGETEVSISSLLRYFKERALPDLGSNIKCGNSLIGYDYYDDHKNLSAEEMQWINAFEWKTEFPEIFERRGFDAVIGNPPYGALFNAHDKSYLKNSYHSMVGKFDSYGFFIEKGLILLRLDGFLGFITPHTWLTVVEAESLRKYILNTSCINKIIRLPTKVFKNATVNTIIFIISKCKVHAASNKVEAILFPRDIELESISIEHSKINRFTQSDWNNNEASMFNIDSDQDARKVISKIQDNETTLRDICDFSVGIQAYDICTGQDRDIIENRAYHCDFQKDETYIRELSGRDVSRYYYEWPGKSWISYGSWLAHPRQAKFFQGNRILVREITSKEKYMIHATYVTDKYINYKTVLNIILNKIGREYGFSDLFILGIINSALISWYFPLASNKLVTKNFPRISILDLKRFPIPPIDFSYPADVARHDRMVELVQSMLDLHKLASAGTDHDKTLLARRIEATDRQIDRLVYELYGL
ncbi:MAG: N-6 DNA methylase, partial [Methanothrix sp.]